MLAFAFGHLCAEPVIARAIAFEDGRTEAEEAHGVHEHGVELFTRYAYPAQIAALVLLVASIAAIVLTLRQRKNAKPQDIAAQVAVRAKDRVRIVKMTAEKR